MKLFFGNFNYLNEVIIDKMISFACGTLLGDTLLHMFPHILENSNI